MKIFQKLRLTFLALALMIALVGGLALRVSHQALKKSIGARSVARAEQIADLLDSYVQERLLVFATYALSEAVGREAEASNARYEAMSDPEAVIVAHDQAWVATPAGSVSPFMRTLVEAPLSQEFRRLQQRHRIDDGRSATAEIFLTNRYGANVAQSGRTSDFRQNDEP